jgi:hypothetical protein
MFQEGLYWPTFLVVLGGWLDIGAWFLHFSRHDSGGFQNPGSNWGQVDEG